MLHGNLRRHSLAGITSLPTCFPGAAELFGDSVLKAVRERLLLVAILLFTDDLNEVRHLCNHATNGERVFALDHLVQTGEAQSLDHQLLLNRSLASGTEPLQLDLGSLRCLLRLFLNSCAGHLYSSSTDLPRLLATSLRSRNFESASNVALITLCGFVVPIDFVSTFWIPAEVMTARTAPPAITPVPSGAGFSSTCPEPNLPSETCGIEVCVMFTLIRFFFADSIPLRIACGTSLALPLPYPTTPEPGSPTTTSAANDMFLPPLTTLVTRLMLTT